MFSQSVVPKKHKNGMIGGIRSRLVDYEALLAEAPGVEAMEKLFQRLDGILFCIKDREGCYLRQRRISPARPGGRSV